MVSNFLGSRRVITSFRCRSCGARNGFEASESAVSTRNGNGRSLHAVLDLGSTPLANRLLQAAELSEPEPTYPLQLVFCSKCSLCQITETVPPELLFRDYVYFSSFSDTMLRHCEEQCETLVSQCKLGPASLVIEAASNDGYFLQYFER